MNLTNINKKPLLGDIFSEDTASLENICVMMGLYGFCLMQSSSSVADEKREHKLYRFINPAYNSSGLPSDEVLFDLVMKKLEANPSSGPVNFEFDFQYSASETPKMNAFVTKSEKLPDVVALFFKVEEAFGFAQIEGLRSVFELTCAIVQQKRTIKVLDHEKTKYRHLFSASPEAIVMLDKNNRIEDANPEFLRMFQYSKDQLIGKEVDALIAPGTLHDEAVLMSQSNWRGIEVSVETQRQRRDGTRCDVLVMGVPFYHSDGRLHVFGIYRDISDRVRAVEQKQQRFEFIEYIGGLSSALINTDINNIDSLIAQALQKVGKSHAAERAYLVMLSEDGSKLEFTHEWAEDERYAHRNTLSYIMVDEVAEYLKCLESGDTFNISRNDVGKDRGTDDIEFFFDLQNIESLLHIPLFSEHIFQGFIGFDTYSRPNCWEPQMVNSLRLTGQILVNALSRKQTEEELNRALLQAKSSDRLKSAFLAGISHEVRTPMNHILGFIELLTEDDISESEKTEFVGIMKKSGMDLLHLIDDVIELALIDSGQVELRNEPCYLSRFMESMAVESEGLKSSIHRSNVQIKLKIDKVLANQVVLTDEYRLRQILNNLISNALKYTPEGRVEIGVSLTAEDTLMFYVNDSGIGIQEKDQEVVFERFHKLENGMLRIFTGAGLGLSISQGLAALFRSKITITSQPGQGSSFTFSVPFIPYEDQQLVLPANKNGSILYDWSGQTALIVEDDPVNMRFLTVLLLKTNIDLLYAADGKEAVELVKTTPIDVVLMDMNLPVMDGYEATRQIKQLRADIPVIAQTAHALSDDRMRCLEAGCDEYMAKPIDKHNLYAMINRFLSPGKY